MSETAAPAKSVESPAELRFVLRDIAFGAQMMLEIPGPADSALKRYAAEVKRVADAALKGNA